MFKEAYLRIPYKARLLAVFVVVIAAIFFASRFLMAQQEVQKIPKTFLEARSEASMVAQEIVTGSIDTANQLNKIEELEKQAKYDEALSLVTAELERNVKMRQKAIELAAYLEIMTKKSADIKPDSSARLALEAISTEMTLMSRLITHNDYLNQLLISIRGRFLDKDLSATAKIVDIVKKMNEEAKMINALNESFNAKLKEFDSR